LLFCSLAFSQNGALRITDPAPSKDGTIVTNTPAISLKGTLAWSGGDMRVLWKNERGFSDLATVTLADDNKTVLWNSTAAVPLHPGINHVRVKALGQAGAAAFVNILYTPQTPITPPVLRTTILQGKRITYEVRDGLAIYQSDMVLGKAADVAAGVVAGKPTANSQSIERPNAITIAPNFFSTSGLWPVVNGVARVPYTITNVNAANTSNINAAIAESNTQLAGVLQWQPATTSDVNLVNFDFDPTNLSGACEANVGMTGKTQTIGGSINCTTTTIMHEMGHAVGLYHEQSRADRDTYVNYMEQNIDKPNHGNFDIIGSSSVSSGFYNYASIMEYGPFSFNKDGVSPTLETIPAGIVLGTDLPQYTTGDLDGIMRLYAHAPTSITVDTNPGGLQVVVDGTECTAPCVFTTWAIGSQHTLSVPLDANNQTLQTLSQQHYIFGRWNAGLANVQTVTVTNSAGNGTLLSPTSSPAVTNYLASFILIHPYSPVVYPSNAGSISPSPAPSSLIINGASTNYYQDRQLVTLTVTPNSGFSFDFWANVALFNFYSNPFNFYITSNFDSSDNGQPATAVLVSDPVTTITAASPDTTATGLLPGTVPGFAIGVVDGNGNTSTAYTPVNFDATYSGSGFAAGKTVTFSSAAVESPVTTNINYQFSNWTGAGTPSGNSLSVVVPASGQSTSTANYTPSFRSIVEPSLYCPDSSNNNELMVTSSPAGTNINPYDASDGDLDAFFTAGTVNFSAVTGPTGLSFVGWSQDLAAGGTTNPFAYSLSGQVLATANFNIPGATVPLTITGVSPVTVTSGAVNLTVTGTGFSTDATNLYTYYVDPTTGYYQYRSNTPTPAGSSTETVVSLNAGDVATAGYYQIVVLNAVPSGCNPSANATFAVANSTGPPVLGITKTHVGNFSQGQQNATYTVLVSNIGKGSTIDPVTVTEAVPSGETLVSMSGSGWSCPSGGNTCTRSDSLTQGMSYGAITVTVNVAANASSPQVNSVTVSGGGAASATATDSTTISTGAPTLTSIAVTPASPSIVKATTQQFTATGTYSDSSTKNLTTSVTWASGTMAVATISSGGLATGVAAGTSSITASLSGATSPADVLTVKNSLGAPTAVSLSPSSGSGLTQTFTGVYSDPNGAADLNTVSILFNTAISGVNACWVRYYPASNLLYLENNTDNGLTAGIAPGSASQVSNSQCTLKGTGSSYGVSGNNATLSVALTFSGTFTGQKNAYLAATENNASTSGWVLKGTWTPVTLGPPTVTSLSPSSGSGLTQTFTGVFSDPNGAADLNTVGILFNTAISGVNACWVRYYPAANLLYLENNTDNGLTAGIAPGSASQVSNSQCTLKGTGSSYGVSGNNATLTVALTFSGTFAGQKNAYLAATENNATTSGWVLKGTWTPVTLGPPTVTSLSPNSGSGLTQTFTAMYSDPNGAADLNTVSILFNTAISGVNACWVRYYPASNLLYLENNADNGLTAGIAPGSASQVSNSQCTLSGTGSSYSVSGNNATLSVALTFSGTFTGQKNAYLAATENNASTSGWVLKGTWTP
jgi:hypothetical protein